MKIDELLSLLYSKFLILEYTEISRDSLISPRLQKLLKNKKATETLYEKLTDNS